MAMQILMDKILAEFVDQAFEASRLGRSKAHTTRDLVSAAMLVELEASGDAMRFLDAKGRIAWKATPNLCQNLKDLERDAQDDLENF
jgi:hypothetical protein